MTTVFDSQGAGAPMADHPEFQELCALFSTGVLNEGEVSRLSEHLAECDDCRRFLEGFERRAAATMSQLGTTVPPGEATASSFDAEAAKKRLFDSIDKNKNPFRRSGRELEYAVAGAPSYTLGLPTVLARPLEFARGFKPYLPYAAGFFLGVGLSLSIYWSGPRKLTDEFRVSADRAESDAAFSRDAAKDLSKERNQLSARLQEEQGVRRLLENQGAQLEKRVKELEVNGTKTSEESRALRAEKEDLGRKFGDLQTSTATLRKELEDSQRQETSESARANELQKRVDVLSGVLKEQKDRIDQQESTIVEEEDLLSHDRDIRDLMGARQLYVAEVYDSDENGKQKKPYARVFYTREKSLIFYGFDLDKQPGVKNAAAFQVWGRRGSNRANALNLGILYEDSTTNKRWSLKINDPVKLEQIDAVFVTIEPKGGSLQPTGRPLLFAYLRIDPNHP